MKMKKEPYRKCRENPTFVPLAPKVFTCYGVDAGAGVVLLPQCGSEFEVFRW